MKREPQTMPGAGSGAALARSRAPRSPTASARWHPWSSRTIPACTRGRDLLSPSARTGGTRGCIGGLRRSRETRRGRRDPQRACGGFGDSRFEPLAPENSAPVAIEDSILVRTGVPRLASVRKSTRPCLRPGEDRLMRRLRLPPCRLRCGSRLPEARRFLAHMQLEAAACPPTARSSELMAARYHVGKNSRRPNGALLEPEARASPCRGQRPPSRALLAPASRAGRYRLRPLSRHRCRSCAASAGPAAVHACAGATRCCSLPAGRQLGLLHRPDREKAAHCSTSARQPSGAPSGAAGATSAIGFCPGRWDISRSRDLDTLMDECLARGNRRDRVALGLPQRRLHLQRPGRSSRRRCRDGRGPTPAMRAG